MFRASRSGLKGNIALASRRLPPRRQGPSLTAPLEREGLAGSRVARHVMLAVSGPGLHPARKQRPGPDEPRLREKAQGTSRQAPRKVIFSAPAKDDSHTIVMGVNEGTYDPSMECVSCASSTTTGSCLQCAPCTRGLASKEA